MFQNSERNSIDSRVIGNISSFKEDLVLISEEELSFKNLKEEDELGNYTFENSPKFRQVSSIIFIEFHNLHGLQIAFHTESHPGLVLPEKSLVESYSLYLIPKPDLSNQIISFVVEDQWLFVGCPQFMEDLKYERNALVWNLLFGFYMGPTQNIGSSPSMDILDSEIEIDSPPPLTIIPSIPSVQISTSISGKLSNSTSQPQFGQIGIHQKIGLSDGGIHIVDQFTPLLRRITHSLRQLENECQLISIHKSQIEKVLPILLSQLNSNGDFSVTFHPENNIFSLNGKLTFSSFNRNPMQVNPWFVPVPKVDILRYVQSDWDLSVQRIIPFINSTRYVKEISKCCNVHINLVQKALKHLVYYDAITFIDIFQYSNIYVIHSKQKMIELFHSREMQDECINYISLNPNNLVKVNDLLALFSKFSVDKSLKSILMECNITNINHKALITYGILRKILVRVHEYPLLKEGLDPTLYEAEFESNGYNLAAFLPYLDGTHCIDEICVEFEIPRNEFLQLLSILEDEYWIIKRKYISPDM